MTNKKLPTFIVLGAEKCGTTALHRLLDEHDDIFVSRKEPEYFSAIGETRKKKTDVTSLEDYQALFETAQNETALGDISTTYLPSPTAATEIKNLVPDAKLVAILRHPAERAFSRFMMSVKHQEGREKAPSCEEFLSFFETQTYNPAWANIRSRGSYGEQLARYYKLFPDHQIRVFLYEEFQDNYTNFMTDFLSFIGVSSSVIPENEKFGVGGEIRSPVVKELIQTLSPVVKRYVPQRYLTKGVKLRAKLEQANLKQTLALNGEARASVLDFYRDDILCLQDVIKRDLSVWLR